MSVRRAPFRSVMLMEGSAMVIEHGAICLLIYLYVCLFIYFYCCMINSPCALLVLSNSLPNYQTKRFCKTSFQVGLDQKKVQKQDRDERTQENYPTCTSAVYFCRCRVVFLRFFVSALFRYIFQVHPYLKWSLAETIFPSTHNYCARSQGSVRTRQHCILGQFRGRSLQVIAHTQLQTSRNDLH